MIPNQLPTTVTLPEPDLDKVMPLVDVLEASLGCRINIEIQAVVTSNSQRALNTVREAFGAPDLPVAGPEKPARNKRGPYGPRKGKSISLNGSKHASDGGSRSTGPRGEIKAWKCTNPLGTVLMLTRSEKDANLASGGFTEGTILEHPRAGRLIVTGQAGFPQRALAKDAMETAGDWVRAGA
jgi:hypothetical protein